MSAAHNCSLAHYPHERPARRWEVFCPTCGSLGFAPSEDDGWARAARHERQGGGR